MKNTKGFVLIVIAIIALIIIGGGIYIAKNKKTEAPVVENENMTSDWKTYTNSKYGFEFKYPVDFNLTVGDGSYSILEMTRGICIIQISENVGGGLSGSSSMEEKDISIAGKMLTEKSIYNPNKILVSRSIYEIFPGYQILAWAQSSPTGIEPCIRDFNIFLSTFKFTK